MTMNLKLIGVEVRGKEKGKGNKKETKETQFCMTSRLKFTHV